MTIFGQSKLAQAPLTQLHAFVFAAADDDIVNTSDLSLFTHTHTHFLALSTLLFFSLLSLTTLHPCYSCRGSIDA